MNDLITITIPSTGRPKKLRDCLNSIDYKNVQISLGVRGAQDVPKYLDKAVSVYSSENYPVKIQNDLSYLAPYCSHILPVTDDIEFEPGAILKAVKMLNEKFPDGDGIVGFDIRNMNDKQKCPYAFMLIGNRFFNERLNRVLLYPEYWHFFADVELGETANRLGLFASCKEAGIIHYHPSAGLVADITHANNRLEKWEHDHRIYQNRKKQWQESGFATFADSKRTILTAA